MVDLTDVLNNLYKGCGFIRKSKYGGRVKGIVEEIFITNSFIFNEDTENMIKFHINHSSKGDKTMEKPTTKDEETYIATQPKFYVKSTNGITYDFYECFFMSKDQNIW